MGASDARGVVEAMATEEPAPSESAPPLPMPPPPNPKPAPPPVGNRGSDRARTMGWIALGIGAEAAIVAGVTSIVILNDLSARSNGCDAQKVCTTAGFGANAQLDSLAGWNAGAWVLAAAGVGVGTWLVLTHRPEGKPSAAVGVTTTGSGAAFSLKGSF
jgi:hypothetical protein